MYRAKGICPPASAMAARMIAIRSGLPVAALAVLIAQSYRRTHGAAMGNGASPLCHRSGMMALQPERGSALDLHERRFLTADDLAYLEAIELALVRLHGISAERAGGAVRPVAREIQRARTLGKRTPAAALFAQRGASIHAEALAALLVAPRTHGRASLGALALLAAIAGLLGMRVLLAVVFRRFAPIQIGWVDVTLALVVVMVILGATRSQRLPDRLGRSNWMWLSLALGIALGLGATALLRTLDIHRTVLTLPLWLAAVLAAACGSLTWLLTWPDDQTVYAGAD